MLAAFHFNRTTFTPTLVSGQATVVELTFETESDTSIVGQFFQVVLSNTGTSVSQVSLHPT